MSLYAHSGGCRGVRGARVERTRCVLRIRFLAAYKLTSVRLIVVLATLIALNQTFVALCGVDDGRLKYVYTKVALHASMLIHA